MVRAKTTKSKTESIKLEDLQEVVNRNQDQLQDLAGQMNTLEVRLEEMLDNLESLSIRDNENSSGRGTRPRESSQQCSDNAEDVINITRESGVYTFRFRSFSFFKWVGVLTCGAAIGAIIMGIFG